MWENAAAPVIATIENLGGLSRHRHERELKERLIKGGTQKKLAGEARNALSTLGDNLSGTRGTQHAQWLNLREECSSALARQCALRSAAENTHSEVNAERDTERDKDPKGRPSTESMLMNGFEARRGLGTPGAGHRRHGGDIGKSARQSAVRGLHWDVCVQPGQEGLLPNATQRDRRAPRRRTQQHSLGLTTTHASSP